MIRQFSAIALILLIAGASCLSGRQALSGEEASISMDFKDADLKDVLKILSQQSGLNFVASEEVKDKQITLYLDKVTVQDALDNIVRANDLRYERESGSGIFILYPTKVRSNQITSRVFSLRHTRLSISALDVGGLSVVKELATAADEEEESDDSGASVSSSLSSIGGENEAGGQKRGIDAVVRTLLSEKGQVTVDLRTNSLIVTDYPQNLDLVEEVLSKLDVQTRQAMIEVEILEVRASVFKDTGVEWGGDDGALFAFTGGTRAAAFPFQESIFQSLDAATNAKSTITLGTLSAASFKATLHFLTNQQDTRILARPRVLTVNNEAAIIKLVTNTAIARVSTQSASEGVSVTTTDTAERADTGIVLKMTPQINENDTVELFLEPSVTTVSASAFFSDDFLDPTTRSVRTTVRVKNGETLVIGGLIDRDDSEAVKKIPFLGDLPLVGGAFSYTNRDTTDRELLIFLTPHIQNETSGGDDASAGAAQAAAGPAEQVSEFVRQGEMERTLKDGEMKRTLDWLGQSGQR